MPLILLVFSYDVGQIGDYSKLDAGLKRCVVIDVLLWASSHTKRKLTARQEMACESAPGLE